MITLLVVLGYDILNGWLTNVYWKGGVRMDITVSNIDKSFDKKQVLYGIDFGIRSGDIVCLLGPSGSGKTTLIRCLIGAIKTEKGEIKYDDITIPNLKLMKSVGFMPQNDALYDDLTGEDNLKFFAGLSKMKGNVLKRRIDEVLELVKLSDDRKKYVANYSGGMKKRLSLAAALINNPKVLLLDEPTVGIDPILRRTIWDKLKNLKATGTTIVVSTHVMDEVSECDKAALIYNGRLINYDNVENLMAKTRTGKVEELFFIAAESFERGDQNV